MEINKKNYRRIVEKESTKEKIWIQEYIVKEKLRKNNSVKLKTAAAKIFSNFKFVKTRPKLFTEQKR